MIGMKRIVIKIVCNAIALMAAVYVVPGIEFTGGLIALTFAGVIMGIVNSLVKPVLVFLSFPFIVLTLGILYLVLNGLLFMLVAALVPGFCVRGLLAAILGSLVVGVVNLILSRMLKEDGR